MKSQCRYCNDCKASGRARDTIQGHGRKHYYCENEEAKKLPPEVFGNKAHRFIGYGENTWESKLAVKTAPRWCPKNRKTD